MNLHWFFRFVAFLALPVATVQKCDRARSRLVRRVVNEKLLPAFLKIRADISDKCPFDPARDMYRTQEQHKSVETGARWTCHFCGKAFISEYFLDLHFDNRHADQIEGNALCLADACDIFRCDVIGRAITPDYWDIALCLEDDMKNLHRQCASMVRSCIRSSLIQNDSAWLTAVMMEELCSYLTCSKYWEIPFETDNRVSVNGLYIVLTVLIFAGLTIYYCIFITYFYTDTFSDSFAYDPTPRTKYTMKPYQPDLRHRPRPIVSS